MSTDINKHLQTEEQTIIREEANRRSLCWMEHFLLVLSGLPALTSSQWQVSSPIVVRSQGCNGCMKGLRQKVLMETSWTWNTSLSVRTTEEEEVRESKEDTGAETWTVACPHRACPILYSDTGQGRQSSPSRRVRGWRGTPTRYCLLLEDWGPAELVLSFTPGDLDAVTVFRQLKVCSLWTLWHSKHHLRHRRFVYPPPFGHPFKQMELEILSTSAAELKQNNNWMLSFVSVSHICYCYCSKTWQVVVVWISVRP